MAKKTTYYLAKVRKVTGLSDYKIAQKYGINQSNLSKYKSGKAALSEMHAWLFADILSLNPAEVVASTKLEQAKINHNKSKSKFWQEQLEKLSDNSQAIKISIAQINPIVGDLSNNAQKIIDLSLEAANAGTDLLVFPEMALVGYPPEDLLLRDGFMQQVAAQIERIRVQTPPALTLIFGAPCKIADNLYNSAYLIQQKECRIYHKHILPNYGVFDEKRYFSAGTEPLVFECQNQRIGIVICEDAWHSEPLKQAINCGATTIISLNASPFHLDKPARRITKIQQNLSNHPVHFIYANLVGGQDELVFDGASFVLNKAGEITHQLPSFIETVQDLNVPISQPPCQIEQTIYDALVLSVKDYVVKNGVFNGAIIGLSGGIDSALTLAIAVDSLGSEAISAVMMPYQYTAEMSLTDAKTQADAQKVSYQQIDIHALVAGFNAALQHVFLGTETDTTEENLQARIRGTLLMAMANKSGKIVLTTSNKSEMAVGYATLYGDMSGGFAPLKDVPKLLVYRLANYRNSISPIIPQRVIERAPSAELSPNQCDQDSLPPYEILDAILALFIEKRQSVAQICAQGFESAEVAKITKLVLTSEHKRRQSAPGPKISAHAFGKERRYPITSKFQP